MQHMKRGLQREGGGGGQNAEYWFIPLLLGDGVLNLNTFPVKFHLTWSKIKKKNNNNGGSEYTVATCCLQARLQQAC